MIRIATSFVAVLIAGVLAVPAFATSFVMVSDAGLAAQADAVVVGRIVAVEPRSHETRPRTRYPVAVDVREEAAIDATLSGCEKY